MNQLGGIVVQAILEKIGTEPLPRAILVHGTEHVLKEKVLAALKERVDSGPMPEWNWSVIEGDSEIDPEPLLVELGTIPWGGATKVIAETRRWDSCRCHGADCHLAERACRSQLSGCFCGQFR